MSETAIGSGAVAGPDAPTAGPTAATALDPVFELVIGGMSCAACAARIERRLNKLDGVAAIVNYATERAYITEAGNRAPDELITAVEAAGYTAALPAPPVGSDLGDETNGSGVDGIGGPAEPALVRSLRRRLWVSGPLAVPVVVLSMVPAAQFAGWQWLCLALAAPVAGWGAWPLHRAAWLNLKQAAATMDTLVSLGVLVSFGWSVYALLFGGAGSLAMRMPFSAGFAAAGPTTLYLDVSAGVTVAVLSGRFLEARARRRSGSALAALAALGARTVAVLRDGTETRVPAGDLRAGELFVVRPGEKFAADGLVVDGRSAVDAALLTGESAPVEVGPGDEVTGATVNVGGSLTVRAVRVGRDTRLAAMTRLVAEAQIGKAAAQRLADRVAGVFVPCVIGLAAVTLGFWLGAGLPSGAAAGAAVAVLVVACPCALGLATPTALLVGVGRGAELGMLIKGAHVLEATRRVDTVVFDKTGTLTTGVMKLVDVFLETTNSDDASGDDALTRDLVLRLVGAVEYASEHPVGQAVTRAASARFGELPAVTGFQSLPGAGVRGTVDGRELVVGRPGLLAELDMAVPEHLASTVSGAEESGQTVVLAAWDGRVRAALVVADTVKASGPAAVTRMRVLGLRPILLTGDNPRTAHAIAARLGIPAQDVLADVRPEGKVAAIRALQGGGAVVAMVGDGVNDAAALVQADLGIAMGTGTDAAVAAGDLTLVGGDPWAVGDAIGLAQATMGTIRGNLAWAFGYNLLAVPLAAVGYLNPLFAGVAMAASSVLVVSNSLRLRNFRGRGQGGVDLPMGSAGGAASASSGSAPAPAPSAPNSDPASALSPASAPASAAASASAPAAATRSGPDSPPRSRRPSRLAR
ncbi:MAG TPA: heavy metal translocating P-type ATPase [Actinocrinis sp.]|nr:heavy metal translocating P-type ATPase [Actinocrinis sp.]